MTDRGVKTKHAVVAYQAEWVFPVSGAPLRHGVVEILGDTIGFVGPMTLYRGARPVDLNVQLQGPAAILPGLVNAHTHLEFSSLEEPIGQPGSPLADWIPQVIQWRRERDEVSGAAQFQMKSKAIRLGIDQSLRAGVAKLGEISTEPWSETMHPRVSPRCTSFMELIALSTKQNEALGHVAAKHLERQGSLARGLSPHAPYTVNLELLDEAVRLSARSGAALQMHLAESPEEIELMAKGEGRLREMLEQAGLWRIADLSIGLKPLDYLERLSRASHCVVAHGNYLEPREVSFLAENRDALSVAYCPRTHDYFGHSEHPVLSMLNSGVNVAIGTDSKASNPDLSILEEMKFLGAQGKLPPIKIVQMATRNGVVALGHTSGGMLATGEPADLTILATGSNADPHEAILDPVCSPAVLILGGRVVDPQADSANREQPPTV